MDRKYARIKKDRLPGRFISFDDVAMRRDEKIVFPHTEWHICADQQWAILGANGSGKTTLIKALCGELPVIAGEITYHFIDDNHPDSLPQNSISHVTFDDQRAAMSGNDLFYQARWNSVVDEAQMRVADFLSARNVFEINPYEVLDRPLDTAAFRRHHRNVCRLLEIAGLLRRRVVELSNGESRKVLIARALLKKPRLLILDNPFSGLDPQYKQKFRSILGRLIRSGLHVMLAVSRADEIPPCISHVLAVSRYRVKAQGLRSAVLGSTIKPGNPRSAKKRGTFKAVHQVETRRTSSVPDEALLQLEDISVAYGRKKILRHITWTVRSGEHWAVLGPNGSGKTTLLSLIMADHPQDHANRITLFGRKRGTGESIWEVKKDIGFVSPELQLYYPVDFNCLDVVCSGFYDSAGLYRRCSSLRRQQALEQLRCMGLERLKDNSFGELSEGEQRLILFCRALVKNPRLLILDEPCQGLDPFHRDRVIKTVDAAVRQDRVTVIFVTHNPRELPSAITHQLKLRDGDIQSIGGVKRL